MKATLHETGIVTLEAETEYEKNFIEYWGTKMYTIEPNIRFPEEGAVFLFLSEKMPDRGVNKETVTEWVELKKAAVEGKV